MNRKPKHYYDIWARAQEMYYEADRDDIPDAWSDLPASEKKGWYDRAKVQRKQSRAALAFCRAYPTTWTEGERDYSERVGQKLIDIAQDELDRENKVKQGERKPPRQPFTWSKSAQGPKNVDPPLPTMHDLLTGNRRSMDTQAPYAAVTTPFVQNGPLGDEELTRRGKIVAYNEIKMAMANRTSDLAVRGDATHPETSQATARGVEILANLLDMLEVPNA
jgi:hypothetical protein